MQHFLFRSIFFPVHTIVVVIVLDFSLLFSVSAVVLLPCHQANVRAELKARADAIQTLPAEEVLRRLAQKGSGNMGGLNREQAIRCAIRLISAAHACCCSLSIVVVKRLSVHFFL